MSGWLEMSEWVAGGWWWMVVPRPRAGGPLFLPEWPWGRDWGG